MGDTLDESKQELISCWGEMAGHWGVSKTMAQVYALLYVSAQPLDTDAVMEALAISRGNANINLHKLLDWKIVERVEMPDTRRDYYVAQKDVWELTYHILEERRQREIQPLIGRVSQIEQEVRRHADEAQRPLTQEEAEFVQNVQQMSDFLRLFEDIAQRLLPLLRQRQLLQLSGWMDLFAKPS